MNPSPTPAQLEALRKLDACMLANTIETFHVRLRNEGFAAGAVHCLFPRLRPMVGYAVTLRIRGASPPVSGAATYVENTDWWDHVLAFPAPRVLVVEDVSSHPGRGAFLGEVHANLLQALGCVGAITNGAVRDIPAVENLGFQFFAGGMSVSHSYVHIVETGQAAQIDGLTIRPGDLLHGDLHGIQTIPAELVAEIPAVAAKIQAWERALIAQVRQPHVSTAELRTAVSGNRAS